MDFFPFGQFNSAEDFANWAQDPQNAPKLEEFMRRILAGEAGEPPAEARAIINTWLANRQLQTALQSVRAKIKELLAVAARPASSMDVGERLRLCNQHMDGITDALLEMPEPHRTEFFKQLLPIREQLRALKVGGG